MANYDHMKFAFQTLFHGVEQNEGQMLVFTVGLLQKNCAQMEQHGI